MVLLVKLYYVSWDALMLFCYYRKLLQFCGNFLLWISNWSLFLQIIYVCASWKLNYNFKTNQPHQKIWEFWLQNLSGVTRKKKVFKYHDLIFFFPFLFCHLQIFLILYTVGHLIQCGSMEKLSSDKWEAWGSIPDRSWFFTLSFSVCQFADASS